MFIKKLQAHAQKNNQNLSKSIAQFASNTSDPRGTVDVLNNMLQKRQEVLKNSRESIKKKQEMYHKLAKPIPKLKDIITNIDDNGNVSVDTGKISKEGAIEIADKTRKQIKALEDSGKGKGKKYITLIKIRQKLDRNLENNMFDSSEELYKENPNEPDFY